MNNNIKDNFTIKKESIDLAPEYNDYLHQIKRIPVLTYEQEKELFVAFHNGNIEAREKLIESNLRLVPAIVNNYFKGRIDFLDMVEYGNIGLIAAVDFFDETRGYKFSTYASRIIKQKIYEGINHDLASVKMYADIHELINNYKNYSSKYYMENGFYPNIDQIASELNIKTSKVLLIQKYLDHSISLNCLVYDSGKSEELIDTISDNTESINKIIEKKELKTNFISLFSSAKLTYKEMYVILNRYELINTRCQTYAEISKELDCTTENVRRLEKNALRKMKNCKKAIKIINYLDNPQKIQDEIYSQRKKTKPIHRNEIISGFVNFENTIDPFITKEYVNIMKYIKKLNIDIIKNIFSIEELSFIFLQWETIEQEKYRLTELSDIIYIEQQTIVNNFISILNKLYDYISDGKNIDISNDIIKVRILLRGKGT